MTNGLAATRKRSVVRLAAVAAVLLALLIVGSLFPGRERPAPAREGALVFQGFEAARGDITRVRVTLADTSYTLVRGERGWTMAEAGHYPVRPDRLASLADGLAALTWGEARTRDVEKFDRIGLGDPAEGGTGALIEIVDQSGDTAFTLIAGRKAGRPYGRRPDDDVAYRLTGDLPPLYTREAWLDFDIVDLEADAISGVALTDGRGQSVRLVRNAGESARDFRPGPPDGHRRLVTRIAGAGPALAMARLAPLDAKPVSDLSTPPVGEHVTLTFDGLEIAARAYREPDGLYLTLRAIEAGEGARRAETINAKAEGWAFRLSDYDWADFTPRVDALLRPQEIDPASIAPPG